MIEDEAENPEDFFSFYAANNTNLPSNYNNINNTADLVLTTDEGEKILPAIKN